jgi:hypothetical protein
MTERMVQILSSVINHPGCTFEGIEHIYGNCLQEIMWLCDDGYIEVNEQTGEIIVLKTMYTQLCLPF